MLFLCVFSALAVAGNDDVTKAVSPVTGASNYQFTVEDQLPSSIVLGKYQKETPLYALADKLEFFRKGDVLVYRQGDKWQRTRTGTLSDPLPILGASAKVRAARLPHEELGHLEKALTNIKKAGDKDQTILTGDIPEKTAKELARTEDRDLARSGTAKLWLDARGQLTKYQIDIRVLGKRGNADVDGVMTRTITLSQVGATKVEVPEAARKALE